MDKFPMPGPSRVKDANGKEYYAVPSRLVHAAILSIIGGMVGLGGYMATWAYSDIRFKTTTTDAISDMEREMHRLDSKIDGYPPQWLRERVVNLDKRLDRIEEDHRKK